MMRVTPCRLTILQFSQRGLIDGLTFIASSDVFSRLSLEPVGDPATGEVVWGQLDLDPVAGEDADEVHAHLAGHVREDAMPVLEFDPEHRVRQWLDHRSLDLDCIFLRHASLTPPCV